MSFMMYDEDDRKTGKGLSSFMGLMKDDVLPKYADFLLLACCFCSGIVDSTMFNAYNTFVSMQTGNTIFLGLGASHQNTEAFTWARSLTAIGCFIIGSFFFSRLNFVLGPRKRVTLILSFLIQSILTIITAGLIQGNAIDGSISNLAARHSSTGDPWNQEVPIVLLSIQSAGQIVASRVLGYNEVPTVVITSLLCDLMADPKLFLLKNKKRDRRVVAFLLTLIGAIAGGWISKAADSVSPGLWIVAGIKFFIAVAWFFWGTEAKEEF